MVTNSPVDYLAGLADNQRQDLISVNGAGLAALRRYLSARKAVAFLGAGVSAPLYPPEGKLIGDLLDAATDRLTQQQIKTCQAATRQGPEEVAEIIRRELGAPAYREVLREALKARVDPESGRSWTPVQELVCRCAFKGVVTTAYDPGIVDARMKVRSGTSATGFTTWEDELELDRWQTGDVFEGAELPVLFAHGQHNRPDSVVLATTDYRRAYAGKLPSVLARLTDGHLAWIGFSFTDQRVTTILREVANRTGTRIDPGPAPRHVAVMAWDPDAPDNDPRVLARQVELAYGAQLVLYPAPGDDHSSLEWLLADLTDGRFPSAAVPSVPPGRPRKRAFRAESSVPLRWVPEPEHIEHFTGRGEELSRLDRWAVDSQVSLIGVTAWGGAGKTALVTRWVEVTRGAARRPGLRGTFGWSFYADPSAEHFAEQLLRWAERDLQVKVPGTGRLSAAVLRLLRAAPLLLVLDGLEVIQQGPAGDGLGRLLDGTLREVLAGVCQQQYDGLVVLTSRFPFADLEGFDGGSARMLDVPPFTPAEGSRLLANGGGGWLAEDERRTLVRAVDGHALATGVIARLLAARIPASDLAALHAELDTATRTSTRVRRVLDFYADRLSEPDRYLLAAVSLFARPVSAGALLALVEHEAFGGHLAGWTAKTIQAAIRERLSGLASWHPDGTVSAHPLIRDTFRPLVLGAAGVAAETALGELPTGMVTTRADAIRVVEAIELLLDADQWQAADDLYRVRTGNGEVWKGLPAARLGQRAANAFAATRARRDACATHLDPRRRPFYLSSAGLFALYAGDLAASGEFLPLAVGHYRDDRDNRNLAISLRNLSDCYGQLGNVTAARDAAAESLSVAHSVGNRESVRASYALLAWLAALRGDTAEAESQFAAADEIEVADDREGAHLYSVRGIWWAEWLARTGRLKSARALTDRNLQLCRKYGWNQDVARCRGLLGRLSLMVGDTTLAGRYLAEAIAEFRIGDLLTELAPALADLAEEARSRGDLEAAERHAAEAMTIAGPRGLLPAQSAVLSARAHIRASMVTATGNTGFLSQGRDAADAALRLATHHQLAWHELDALRAHAALDQAGHADNGWADQVGVLYARIAWPRLDPDPPATIRKRIMARRRREDGRLDNDPAPLTIRNGADIATPREADRCRIFMLFIVGGPGRFRWNAYRI